MNCLRFVVVIVSLSFLTTLDIHYLMTHFQQIQQMVGVDFLPTRTTTATTMTTTTTIVNDNFQMDRDGASTTTIITTTTRRQQQQQQQLPRNERMSRLYPPRTRETPDKEEEEAAASGMDSGPLVEVTNETDGSITLNSDPDSADIVQSNLSTSTTTLEATFSATVPLETPKEADQTEDRPRSISTPLHSAVATVDHPSTTFDPPSTSTTTDDLKSSGKALSLPKQQQREEIRNDHSGTSKHPKQQNQKQKLRKIKWLTKDDVFARGPSLHSFHLWSQYLHYSVYEYGIPLQRGTIHHRENNIGYVYDGFVYSPPDVSIWDNNKTHWKREGRFPSVEDRIKFYMGRWYDAKPNPNLFYEKEFQSKAERHQNLADNEELSEVFLRPLLNPFNLSPQALFDFSQKETTKKKTRLVQLYVRDIIDLAILHSNSTTPILIKMGDGSPPTTELFNYSYPVFGKVRDLIADADEVNHWRFAQPKQQPHGDCRQCGMMHSTILWPLNRARHFKKAALVPQFDVPWQKKKGMLVWRGGSFSSDMESLRTLLPMELSSFKQRMALVKNHLKSKSVNAKFSDSNNNNNNNVIPQSYIGNALDIQDMLQYKYIMSIEGNDVSSGLKWMLFSNSVVFLPPMTYASWAMEPFLEPFVHYVPVHANMTNVEEMVEWCERNQREAKKIAERGTLFVYDLLFHEDSMREEEVILEEMMRRYEGLFGGGR